MYPSAAGGDGGSVGHLATFEYARIRRARLAQGQNARPMIDERG
jgi:hypothetical protein